MNRYQVDYKIPGKYGYKYIVLADFHGVFNMKMANSIQAMDIKYIIIAGDLLNGYEWTNKKKIKELREFLNVISRGHTVIVCLGKTNLCRGIIYFDDMAREKVWQSPDNKYYQNVSLDLMKYDWQEIEESVANAIILGDNLHGMLISEGISPGFLANEKWATINIIDFIAC